MVTHKSRRGALLAQLEHRCVNSGFWIIEGHMVIKDGVPNPGAWSRRPPKTWHRRFVDALEAIAEQTA